MIECIMIVFISRMTINYNHEINKSMHTCSKWLWWHLRQPILKFNSHRLQRIKTELHTATVSLSKKPVTVKRGIGAYAKVILKLCISQSQCQTKLQLIDKSFWSNVKMSWFKRESLSIKSLLPTTESPWWQNIILLQKAYNTAPSTHGCEKKPYPCYNV